MDQSAHNFSTPEVLETIGRQPCVAHCMLDVAAAKIGLQCPRVMTLLARVTSQSVPQHLPHSPPQRLIRCGSSCRLCLLHGGLTIQRFRIKPAARQIIPVKIPARAPIGKPNLEAPASRDGLVFDDADAVCHPDILAPCARTNTESGMPPPCCSEQLAASCNSLILLAPVRGTQQHGFSQKNKWELREVLVLQRLWLAITAERAF
jgi:hypothetical protein